MCLILQPTSQCKVCFRFTRFEDVNQFCANIAYVPDSGLGSCGVLKLQRVQRLTDYVCEACRWSAEQDAKDFYEFLYPSPHKYFGDSGHGFAEEFLSRLSAPPPGLQRPFDQDVNGIAYSLPLLAISVMPPGPSSLQPGASIATTHLNHRPTRAQPTRSRYEFHSSSSSESEESPGRDSQRLHWANIANLMSSKKQPPPLNILGDPSQDHPETPQSAAQLRIESPWGARVVSNPEEDPWWYPEIWGPAKDLPDDLAEALDQYPPQSTVHGHDIHVFDSNNSPGKWEENLTVIIVTPRGRKARVMSGEVYDEGATLVGRRMIERARYEHISDKEREYMSKAGRSCFFRPCTVASCPLSHERGQHQPWPSRGENLLESMARGHRMRKNWWSRTAIPRPVTPTSNPRQYSSHSPMRRRPAPLDLTKTKAVRFNIAVEDAESVWSRGNATPHPAGPQATVSDEDEDLATPWSSEPLFAPEPRSKGDLTAILEYEGRVGRIRPRNYNYDPAGETNGSPRPHVRSTASRDQQTGAASIHREVRNARRAAARTANDGIDTLHVPSEAQRNASLDYDDQDSCYGFTTLSISDFDEDCNIYDPPSR
ncbi:hypothetical protein CORC01_01544 [Colletotrichum orchidophilum]|uniref:Uncharacterized protein n=1 Tax=Colletotrichum orchidophilum TaxID=1209926 RepID=A0A1G4BNX5_9PEZI|nr:uncharacterized protein CORC01_01544 [Colletotrichum orchidophilum]OHF03160.1 hypothetical protein CORC01_01544 [Colletotrichum orchidophilum]